MKHIYTIFLLLLSITFLFAGGGKKTKDTTSSSGDNDDPGKDKAFCMKYGTKDTLYLDIDSLACPNYQFNNIVIEFGSPHFQIDTTFTTQDTLTAVVVTIDTLPINVIQPKERLLLTAYMSPATNAAIECSRSEIPIYVYLSKEGCEGIDTTLSTGKCYTCKADAQNQFPAPKYAHFSWVIDTNNHNITFSKQCQYQLGDTILFYFGNNVVINVTNLSTFVETYTTLDTFEAKMEIRCQNHQNQCLYTAKAHIRTGTTPIPLPIEEIQLTTSTNNKNALLSWSFIGSAISYYEIQRTDISPNLNQWQKIGKTVAQNFTDAAIEWGKTYHYRIVAFDMEGKSVAISNIEAIMIDSEMSVSPNPTAGELQIEMDTQDRQQKMYLVDAIGNVLNTWENVPEKLNISHLPAGRYYLKIGAGSVKVLRM